MNIDYSGEFQAIVDAYKKTGGDAKSLLDTQFASLVINWDRVLSKNEIPGIHIKTRHIKDGVSVKLYVADGVEIKFPVHLCFGMLPREGRQVIKSEFFIGKAARIRFLSHCSFPNAENITHVMDAKVHIAEAGQMEYLETHYHSTSGGIKVYPKLRSELGKAATLREEFKLTTGRVGFLKVDYEVEQAEHSICELETKIFGKRDDRIEVKEALHLNGEYASGIAKSRIVLTDSAFGNVLGEIAGNAPYTRGHTDCQEILQGEQAIAVSTPKISVKSSLAKVTHEAAIGRIDKKELETLMARGLEEEEAVDLIVKGILK